MDDTYRSPWQVDDVAELASLSRRFFTTEAAPRRAEWAAQRHVDRVFWRQAAKLGLLCAGVPAEYGGGGGDARHDLVVIAEQARAGEFGFGNAVHSGVVARYLVSYGTDGQKRRWLPPMASGDVIAGIALTEPEAGSDLKAIRTRAERDGDGWRVSGAKSFVTNGGSADLLVVAAKTNASAGARGISLFLVPVGDQPGVVRGRVLDKIGQESADTSDITLEDVRLPAEALLGRENAGYAMLLDQLSWERLLVGVMAAAVTERAVELTVAYAHQRMVYDDELFALQHVRMELAECATLAQVGRVFVDHCVARHLDGTLDARTASMAKFWLSDVQCQVLDRCLQLHGANGYTRDYPIGQLYVDARAQRIYGGANEVMKELIAGTL
ncbi:acyl-CoA dehydrogenase family protein [Micromonospora sp. DT227]|uniref:acyl-CoA dehydrogenase family protein n=1 Tax=Micromonospora sp. DT227 TaxID=3393433 RepID=UPI003CED4ADE